MSLLLLDLPIKCELAITISDIREFKKVLPILMKIIKNKDEISPTNIDFIWSEFCVDEITSLKDLYDVKNEYDLFCNIHEKTWPVTVVITKD